MVQRNELRIGNYIMTGLGAYEIVYDVLCDSVNTVGGTRLYDDISPIPLSAEILKKCGFVLDRNDSAAEVVEYYNLKIPVSGSNKNEITFFIGKHPGVEDWGVYTVNGYWGSNNFQYLHQLQNLYFALTGEELPVEL